MDTGKLLRLAHKSLKTLDAKIKTGKVKPTKYIVMREKITELQISEKESRATSTNVPSEKDDWSSTVYDVVEKDVKKMPMFNEIVRSIVKDYKDRFPPGVNKCTQASLWLGNFISTVLYKKLENRLTEELLVDLITTFMSELDSAPIEHHLIAFIDGVYSKVGTIELNSEVRLRNPKPSDLEYEYYISPFFIPSYRPATGELPSAVIEIKMRAKSDFAIQEERERVLNVLRLFRLGSVYTQWSSLSSKSVMWIRGISTSWGFQRYAPLYKYVVDESNAADFKKFFDIFEPLVPFKATERQLEGLSVALNWYNNALLEPVEIERKLMMTVMGLESLYSLPSDRGEIEFRLSSRVAKFLGLLGKDPIGIRGNIQKSYKIRSKVAHGFVVSAEKRAEIGGLLREVLEYLRKSLVIFPQVGLSKNGLVSLIDNSMVSDSVSEELKEKIKDIFIP